MNKKTNSLAGLLNLNGSIRLGENFREPYHFNYLLNKNRHRVSEDILGIGEILVEKLKRIKAIHGHLRNFGLSPFFEKFVRKNQGKTV